PKLGQLDAAFEVLEVPPGEESKSLEVAANLWSVLLEYGADRNSLIINVGGGVVCDLGALGEDFYAGKRNEDSRNDRC
ncbi:hypothetical protein N8450_04965, partial [Schleiferiaceae bacterium]|nr:hypothetical protein [Schleiferiaceae bacterium]